MKKFKEWFRKRMVTLKRKPNYIPLTMLIISCLALNLKLTAFSDTIMQINEPGMGICIFTIVLFSFLSIISFLTAFPNRQKPKIMSIIVCAVMLIVSIGCQLQFNYFIRYGTELKPNPIKITPSKNYIIVARQMGIIHIVLMSITLILIFTLPLYKKLISRFNTSVAVEPSAIDENSIDKSH